MADKRNDTESCEDIEAMRSRRAFLKMLAGAPLVVTFGLALSPLMRFLKPTMKPLNFFQAADLPGAEQQPRFQLSDFPQTWNCLPLMFPMKILVFNPEEQEIRQIPGFVIRIENNRIVAYSRYCTARCEHILNYVMDPMDHCCGGCPGKAANCKCVAAVAMASLHIKTPVLVCPQDGSIFDVNDGRVLAGPARYPARQFKTNIDGQFVSISHLEWGGIA